MRVGGCLRACIEGGKRWGRGVVKDAEEREDVEEEGEEEGEGGGEWKKKLEMEVGGVAPRVKCVLELFSDVLLLMLCLGGTGSTGGVESPVERKRRRSRDDEGRRGEITRWTFPQVAPELRRPCKLLFILSDS